MLDLSNEHIASVRRISRGSSTDRMPLLLIRAAYLSAYLRLLNDSSGGSSDLTHADLGNGLGRYYTVLSVVNGHSGLELIVTNKCFLSLRGSENTAIARFGGLYWSRSRHEYKALLDVSR